MHSCEKENMTNVLDKAHHSLFAGDMPRSRAVEDPDHAGKPNARKLGNLGSVRARGGGGKGESRDPTLDDAEKSSNKAVMPAEIMEGRREVGGDTEESSTCRRSAGQVPERHGRTILNVSGEILGPPIPFPYRAALNCAVNN